MTIAQSLYKKYICRAFLKTLATISLFISCVMVLVPGASSQNDIQPEAQTTKLEKPALTALGWFEDPANGAPIGHLTTEPKVCLRDVQSTEEQILSDIGAVAFRSPVLFGGLAARKKLTCQACHRGGGINDQFFIKGLSDRPGHIDVTAAIFSKVLENNQFDPIPIPTLHGVGEKPTFGTVSEFPSLDAFVTHVIETEFSGPSVHPRIKAGLLIYLERFEKDCAPSHLPITVTDEMDRVRRTVRLAGNEWQSGQGDVVRFLLLSAQHELGLIHERFPFAKQKSVRKQLASLGRTLHDMREYQVDDGENGVHHVQSKIDDWLVSADKLTKRLEKLEARSLYAVPILTQWLEQSQR